MTFCAWCCVNLETEADTSQSHSAEKPPIKAVRGYESHNPLAK